MSERDAGDPGVPSEKTRRRGAGRLLAALVGLAIGVALLGLAVPRTMAAWLALPAQAALEDIQFGRPVEAARLSAALDALSAARRWNDSPRVTTDMALLRLARAELAGTDRERRMEDLRAADGLLRDGLARSPGNAFAWLRLAIVREQRNGPSRAVADALMMSIDLAPNMKRLWLPRLAVAMRNWRFLREDEASILRRQFRLAWSSLDQATLAGLADANNAHLIALWALADEPDIEDRYRDALRAYDAKRRQ